MAGISSFTRTRRAALGIGVVFLLAQGVAAAVDYPGAGAVEPGEVRVQRHADSIRPTPAGTYGDRGEMYADGCQLTAGETEPIPCVYGDPGSKTTVVLVGDSTAMHYFPGLKVVAQKRGWRLVGMTKAGCSMALYDRNDDCEAWQQNILDRLTANPPAMVITGGQAKIGVTVDGTRIPADESAPVVEAGWEDGFRELKKIDTKIVLMASGPMPPFDVPSCVKEHRDDFRPCAMDRTEALGYVHTDVRAARRVGGIGIEFAWPILCNENVCPSVLGNVIVYRQTQHLTATWARTMGGHLHRMLPPARSG